MEDVAAQRHLSRSDSESGCGCRRATLWMTNTNRLMLCSLCLLSHCSKSVYSKSLDIPDASTKCSKEERYSPALFTSSCSVSHPPCKGYVHSRRKMQRCFQLKDYFKKKKRKMVITYAACGGFTSLF